MLDIDAGVQHFAAELFDVMAPYPRCAEPGGDLGRFELTWEHPLQRRDVGPVSTIGIFGGAAGVELGSDVARQVLRRGDEPVRAGLVVDQFAELLASMGRVGAEEFRDGRR